MANETISPRLREDFVNLIAQQTGIEIRSQNYGALGDNIFSRVKALQLSSPQAYLDLLTSLNVRGEEEWQTFVCLLTNRESYFFRDKGQISLLRQTILPELIRVNQRSKSLRLCSAGCSTGQEPYSLAILLTELIPDIENWTITIIGMDINRESLDHGKKALYNTWSFRQVEESIKERYFKNMAGYYKLDSTIQRTVKFHQVNLVRDSFPRLDSELNNMDFIICRNVFIYFTDQAIGKVVEKFFNTLKPNGYLLTGHAELGTHHTKSFQSKLFPESIIYQKKSDSFNNASAPAIRYTPPVPEISAIEALEKQLYKTEIKINLSNPTSRISQIPVSRRPLAPVVPQQDPPTLSDPDLSEIETLIQAKSYSLAAKKLELFLAKFPRNFKASFKMAELQANLGQHKLAQHWCETAIAINELQLAPYFLLAEIAEEQNNLEVAKQMLKKVIYLDPQAIAAYINLANLYQKDGDRTRCQKMQQTALKLLQKLPADQPIPRLGSLTAQDLMAQLS